MIQNPIFSESERGYQENERGNHRRQGANLTNHRQQLARPGPHCTLPTSSLSLALQEPRPSRTSPPFPRPLGPADAPPALAQPRQQPCSPAGCLGAERALLPAAAELPGREKRGDGKLPGHRTCGRDAVPD
ncbi:Hypothetical predicted protein [Marmota monax]|uniref:Uncharacterized protein n=1 Tax=Marmota monax TaxID=9995 RepID=A0A5E4B542_MARMO|nr:Hypothetical predicted protein [Marmota monax]